MRIHHNADAGVECVSEDDVGGLASDAVQFNQLFHGARDFAAVLFDDRPAAGFDAPGFVPIKACGLDFTFQCWEIGFRVISGGPVFPEQIGCDDVDAFIGALGGENSCNQQFERGGEIEFAMRVGVGALECGDDFCGAIGFRCGAFARHGGGSIGRVGAGGKMLRLKFPTKGEAG